MKTQSCFRLALAALLPAALIAQPVGEWPAALFSGRPVGVVLESLPSAAPADPGDAFGRAAVDFLAATEALVQDLRRLGLDYPFARELPLPIFRLALPSNPSPEVATPEKVRAVLDRFYARLSAVDERLAALPAGEFKRVFPLGAVAVDFDGDGKITEGETFARLLANMNRRPPDTSAAQGAPASNPADLTVAFDRADAMWLQAYTHVLRGFIDLLLAHDGGALFATTGHLFFQRAETPMAAALPVASPGQRFDPGKIADAIALIHGISLPVSQPERLAAARTHLLAAAALSRATLESIAAETDDDREWLPGPNQTSAFGLALTAAQADGWRLLLTELEDLLEGRKLLPHWRFADGRGVNVKRLLLESRRTDLVLLAQGTDVLPYLEKGPLTRAETWRDVVRLFEGNFIGYAVWIN